MEHTLSFHPNQVLLSLQSQAQSHPFQETLLVPPASSIFLLLLIPQHSCWHMSYRSHPTLPQLMAGEDMPGISTRPENFLRALRNCDSLGFLWKFQHCAMPKCIFIELNKLTYMFGNGKKYPSSFKLPYK